MSHSVQNIEHHHFKFDATAGRRRPCTLLRGAYALASAEASNWPTAT